MKKIERFLFVATCVILNLGTATFFQESKSQKKDIIENVALEGNCSKTDGT